VRESLTRVRRLRTDPSPIEPLYRAHFDAIFRYAACRVGRETALDVAAETFAQALRSLSRLDTQRDPRPWLFGIAANVLRHHRRAESRRLRAYERAGGDEATLAPDPAGPGRRPLVEALATLHPGDREALLLFAWADLSYDEVGAALQIPVGTVRSRINRARRILRAALATDHDAAHPALSLAAGEES
jgi:RNA polymerase sigma factor (sigma-70 family)